MIKEENNNILNNNFVKNNVLDERDSSKGNIMLNVNENNKSYKVSSNCICSMCNLYNDYISYKDKLFYNLAVEYMKQTEKEEMGHDKVASFSTLDRNHLLIEDYKESLNQTKKKKDHIIRDIEAKLKELKSKLL